MTYKPIESYGVIGDLHTVALVGLDGSIDFLCLPEFDSPSVFAALLDDHKGGRFCIAPVRHVQQRRQFYLPDTNVLFTRFLSEDGIAELSDFMPVEDGNVAHNLVRRIKTVRGMYRYYMICEPSFDYGRAEHTVQRCPDGVLFVSRGKDATALRLRSTVPIEIRNGAAVAEFTLRAGEKAPFVLEMVQEGKDSSDALAQYVADSFKRTVNFWRQWLGRITYQGRWRETVNRSALALKLLTSQRWGSIVAAPTFGLPEQIGGERNWDYRFTWIRDASFTLCAFLCLGLHEEAHAFFRWMERNCTHGTDQDGGPLQIMYGLDGRRKLEEETLPHWEGYRGSKPVRIGNAAYRQLQLDIYGELLDAAYVYDEYGEPIHHDLWQRLVEIVQWVCDNWQRKDKGIWEVRGGDKAFLYSRVMCWVALDRAIRIAQRRSLPGPISFWHDVRDEIYRDVFTHFWDESRRAFVQSRGGDAMDASALVMPLVKFVSPTDPRWVSTLAAIEHDLLEDSFVYRYRAAGANLDGLKGQEGTFSICSFWYVDSLARRGELDQARFYLEKLLGHANHLGLYSEELGPCGEHLGNFPQAFTHLALIMTIYDLDRRLTLRKHPERAAGGPLG